MTKFYKVPFLSHVAKWVAFALPTRVRAWIWITAYQDLDHEYQDVDHRDPDGSRSLFSAVSATRVENLVRAIWYTHLKATLHERSNDDR